MTPEQIKDAIKTRVNTQLEQAQSVIVQYDNVDVVIPDNALWLRAAVLTGESAAKSIGASTNTTRNIGILMISIFVPINTGDKETYDMITIIRTAFKPGSYSGVTYKTSSIIPVGRNQSGHQTNVAIPYMADELV